MTDEWTPEILAQKLKDNPSLRIDLTESKQLYVETAKKMNKYHTASKEERTYNGVVYRSKKEARFAAELDLRIEAGEINFWLYEVPFQLIDTVYELDFVTFKFYLIPAIIDNCEVFWTIGFFEVKGFKTRLGELKRKQTESLYGIKIQVV